MNKIRNLSLLIFVLVSADNLIWAWGAGKGCDCSWQGHTESVLMTSQLPRWDGYTGRGRGFLRTVHARLPSRFSHAQLSATLWTATRQAPLFMGFSKQEYRSGLPCPPLGYLPYPGIEPASHISCTGKMGSLPLAPPGKPFWWQYCKKNYLRDSVTISLNIFFKKHGATQHHVTAWMGGEFAYMYTYDWIPSLFTWNYHNIVC